MLGRFLFDTQSAGYRYYARKVEEYSKPPGFLANVAIPPGPPSSQALPQRPPSNYAQPPLPNGPSPTVPSQAQPIHNAVNSQPFTEPPQRSPAPWMQVAEGGSRQGQIDQQSQSLRMPHASNTMSRPQAPVESLQVNPPSADAQVLALLLFCLHPLRMQKSASEHKADNGLLHRIILTETRRGMHALDLARHFLTIV